MHATLDIARCFQQRKMVPCKTNLVENALRAFILKHSEPIISSFAPSSKKKKGVIIMGP